MIPQPAGIQLKTSYNLVKKQYPRIPNAQGRGSISKNISLCTIAAPASNLFFLLERLRVYSTTTTILLHVVDSSQCCLRWVDIDGDDERMHRSIRCSS